MLFIVSAVIVVVDCDNMNTSGNTILITGGATGIGFALAELLVKEGNKVMICGRRMDKLEEAKRRVPQLHIKKCDVSDKAEVEALYGWIDENFREINVLVNNAGVQRPVDFNGSVLASLIEEEIDINLKAQISLAAHFVPLLLKRKEAAIVNVSSGLGFVPIAAFPIYCATKAAIHSFSMSLRHQLKQTSVKVFEVVPPIVHDTELKGKFLERSANSVSAAEVAGAVVAAMKSDEYEVAVGPARGFVDGSKEERNQAFDRMNH